MQGGIHTMQSNQKHLTINVLGKQIPLGTYIQSVKYAKAHPTQTFSHGLSTWWPTTGPTIVKQFLIGVHDRINIRGNIQWNNKSMGFYRKKYFHRLNLKCRNCGVLLMDKDNFNPNGSHHFCSSECNRDYFQ